MRRGTVHERPWGLTLASFSAARAHGQLTLTAADGKLYGVAFADGAIVGASSPVASDAAVRVALTTQLVTSVQVPALARAVSAAPGRDEVEVIAEAARLSDEQVAQLRRRLLLQRVARTFVVERGGYVFGEQITVATMPGIEIDVGPAIFLGVRMNLSQDRLAEDLRRLGARFVLRAGDVDEERFGFGPHERPILQALRIGTSLPELEAKRRDLEPRLTQAVIYTLVAAGLCEGLAALRSRDVLRLSCEKVEVEVDLAEDTTLARVRPTAHGRPSPEGGKQAKDEAKDGAEDEAKEEAEDVEKPRTRTISSLPPPMPPMANLFATRDVIASGLALLEAGADHFALLGIPRDATLDAIRAAYVALANHLHPEKRPELDPARAREAQRLFAQVNLAYGVLSDPVRRADYLAGLRGLAADPVAEAGAGAPPPRPAGTATERIRVAAEVAQRGMQALRREDLPTAIELLTRATEIAPQDVDYAAQLAWARFVASTDKAGIAAEVRRVLERAILRSPKPAMARFYLGRVERMLGRVSEALHHFREVLQLEPSHAEAAAEIRLLEPRTARR